MTDWIANLKNCALFTDIASEELRDILRCSASKPVDCAAQEILLRESQPNDRIGIVLRGRILQVSEDYWGNRSIWGSVGPGELFGTVFALLPEAVLPYNVISAETGSVLFLNRSCVTSVCSRTCAGHLHMLQNLLKIVAIEQMNALRKLEHMSHRTTREKLLSFLSEQARQQQTAEFDLPYNRQELADYLAVERSAMSAELSRMQREGLICFQRNHFELINRR